MTEALQILYGDTAVGTLTYDRLKDSITLSYGDAVAHTNACNDTRSGGCDSKRQTP